MNFALFKKIIISSFLFICSIGLIGTSLPIYSSIRLNKEEMLSVNLRLKSLSEKALKKAKELDDHHLYPYPCTDFIEEWDARGMSEVLLFSYGSLMSRSSARQTLGESTVETVVPALSFGVKRVFNYCKELSGSQGSMLNVKMTQDYRDVVNGVIFRIQRSDLSQLLEREQGYDLVPVICTDWKAFTERNTPQFFVAYTFRAKSSSPYIHHSALPKPEYHAMTDRAAKEYGQEFYDLWLRSTYCADGVTPIHEREQMGQS